MCLCLPGPRNQLSTTHLLRAHNICSPQMKGEVVEEPEPVEIPDEEKYPLIGIPDDQLSPDLLKEKRRQKAAKGLDEHRKCASSASRPSRTYIRDRSPFVERRRAEGGCVVVASCRKQKRMKEEAAVLAEEEAVREAIAYSNDPDGCAPPALSRALRDRSDT